MGLNQVNGSKGGRPMRNLVMKSLVTAIAVTLVSTLAVAQAPSDEFILRANADQLQDLITTYDLEVLDQLDPEEPEVVLVRVPESAPPEITAEMVLEEEEVESFEPVRVAGLIETSTEYQVDQSTTTILDALTSTGVSEDSALNAFFSEEPWNGYINQPAMQITRLHEAHQHGYGSGTVAIIDSGVDPSHPLLQDALVPGYDFILDQAGDASEWNALDEATRAEMEQSTTTILDQSTTTILDGDATTLILNQSTTTILDQSTTTILDGIDLPPAFGHGTMVAGVVRLAAPAAKIMPLRVFGPDGTADVYEIIRAIRWAVRNGADVINMSFSVEEFSPELSRAINYAHRHGVVCVAAAGNRGERVVTYPAAFGNSVGVASTSNDDLMSDFSNHGSDVATMAAPGEGIITTYPGGLYAAAWGTSFAAPFVSGTVALLHHTNNGGHVRTVNFYKALYALARGADFVPALAADLAGGRLDSVEAVDAVN